MSFVIKRVVLLNNKVTESLWGTSSSGSGFGEGKEPKRYKTKKSAQKIFELHSMEPYLNQPNTDIFIMEVP